MVEIHILVPAESMDDIESLSSSEFKITQTLITTGKKLRFFRVETTEEEATALILRYGSDRVWIR
jgi:hypothetical protein